MSARQLDQGPLPGTGRKLAVVAAIIAFTTAASGYFMGLRQTERTAARVREESQLRLTAAGHADAAEHAAGSTAPAAPLYRELTDRTRQPNHGWKSQLASLAAAPAFTPDAPRLGEDEAAALGVRRVARRAYSGAPPTVPHPIDQRQSASCLACHGQPTRIGGVDVPQMSHALHSQCIQCHAPAAGPGSTLTRPPPALATPVLANAFAGLPPPAGGTRAHASAPPTIPHSTSMRQNCVSCHGPGGSSIVKTSHPQRQNCFQCHALDAQRETHPVARPPAPDIRLATQG